MQQPNGDPSSNWYTKFGCTQILVALIAGLGTVLASGVFLEAIKPVFSGANKCPISSESVSIKIDNKNLKEGENAYLSFEINDPKKLTSDLEFYGKWDSNLKAKIEPLNEMGQSVKYTAPIEENQVDRYIDTIRLTVEDSTNEKCNLLKEVRISVRKEASSQGKPPVDFSLSNNPSSLKILPFSAVPSSPRALPPSTKKSSTSLVEPAEFVEQYYDFLSQGISKLKARAFKESVLNLELAYKMLSNPFKQSLAPTAYQFESDWKKCGLLYERNSIKLNSKSAEEASVSVIFKQPNCQRKALYEVKLVLNSTRNSWLIDSLQREKYLE
jgi:hypothetical protein